MAKRDTTRRNPRPRGKDAGFEVEERVGPAAAPSLESGLVYLTFGTLVIGLIFSLVALSSRYGQGPF